VPRRRKGIDYCPPIPVLLRDANPTRAEISGDPEACERRDLARGRLAKMYREAEKRRGIDRLDFDVRMFCEQLKREQGCLPKLKGGRPTAEHRRLLTRVRVEEAIKRRGEKRGSVKAAIEEVAERYGVSYDHVSDIYKDRDPDFRAVAVELDLRRRKIHGEG
jgi:hypothetical protein